jgi:hypothetical protein
MSDQPQDRTWTIARLLFATHLPFLLLCWVAFAAAVLVLTFAIDLRVDITRSVWVPAVAILRWFALGYGLYLLNRLLPVYVAHGRTRREFASSLALFVPATAAVLAALLTLGFALEGVLYRAMGWPHQVAPERLFDAAAPSPAVFLSCWAMLVVWTTAGLLLAAGFSRSGGNELVAIVVALAMVALSGLGYGIGLDGLPFVGAVLDLAGVPPAGALGLCLAGLLLGAAVTWAMVRDLPIRNRTA